MPLAAFIHSSRGLILTGFRKSVASPVDSDSSGMVIRNSDTENRMRARYQKPIEPSRRAKSDQKATR